MQKAFDQKLYISACLPSTYTHKWSKFWHGKRRGDTPTKVSGSAVEKPASISDRTICTCTINLTVNTSLEMGR